MVTNGNNLIKETRQTGTFSSLRLSGLLDASIIQDGAMFVELSVAEGLQKNVITVNDNGELRIESAIRCNFIRNYKGRTRVIIHCDTLNAIRLESYGAIGCADTLRAKSLRVDCHDNSGSLTMLVNCDEFFLNNHTGVCDVKASGTCKRFFGYSRATGPFDVRELSGQTAWLNNGSASAMNTGYWNTISAFIYYKGNISYRSGIVEQLVRKGEGQIVLLP